jgi:serine/threonine protein kinase
MKSIFNFDLNRDTLREIEIMKGISHDHIMKYYDSFKTKSIIHNLIIEYCEVKKF